MFVNNIFNMECNDQKNLNIIIIYYMICDKPTENFN